MPTSPYIDGTGILRQRSLAAGDGSTGSPDVAEFAPNYLNDTPITGATIPTGGAGLVGWASAIWSRLNTLGQKNSANSMPVVIASDQSAIAVSGTSLQNIDADLGATNDSAATTDTGTFSLIALVKRLLQKLPTLGAAAASGSIPVTLANDGVFASGFGTTADTAAASDTATASLISLVKRSLQSLTSLINIFSRPNILAITGTISTSGDNTIVSAPGANLSIYITHIVVQNESSTATTIVLKDSGNRLRCLGQSQGNGLALVFGERREIKLTTNTALILNLSGANSCGYSIGYYVGS